MKGHEAAASDDPVERAEDSRRSIRGRDVVAGGKKVSRIGADTEPLRLARRLEHECQFLESGAEAGPLTSGGFERDSRPHARQRCEHDVDALDHCAQAGLDPPSHVRAGMENKPRQLQRIGPDEFFAQCAPRFLEELRIRGREVDHVTAVAEDRAE